MNEIVHGGHVPLHLSLTLDPDQRQCGRRMANLAIAALPPGPGVGKIYVQSPKDQSRPAVTSSRITAGTPQSGPPPSR